MAAHNGRPAQELDVGALQGALLDAGAIILERAAEVRRIGDEAGVDNVKSASL